MANNYCHLSYEERINLENGLNERKSITQISKELGRSHSTILREIQRNKVYSKAKNWSLHPNFDPINQHKYDNCIKLVHLEVDVENQDIHIMQEKLI